MELDGYCPELALAFEHHGIQHYEHVRHFKTNQIAKRKADDAAKMRICRREGVTLIVIPALQRLMSVTELKGFIRDECIRAGLKLPKGFDEKKVDVSAALRTSESRLRLSELAALAQLRGGELLSREYVDSTTKLRWRCRAGHEWLAHAGSVKNNGSWCKRCAGYQRKTIGDMRSEAAARGWQCLSARYLNAHQPLEWMCEAGHVFKMRWNDVRGGHGCSCCAQASRRRN